MQCPWSDAAASDVELLASKGMHWRGHLAGPVAEITLVYWGEVAPFDLQLLARILEEGVLRCNQGRMSWSWLRLEADALPPASTLCVMQQDVGRHASAATIQQIAERCAPTVFIGPAAAWFATSSVARGQRVAIHWEDAASREHLADDVVPSPSIIEVSGRWTTCAGGFAVADLGLLMLGELAGSGVALQVMDALCVDRLREPGSRQRTAAAGVLGALVPKLAEAIALMEANVEEPLQTDEIARLVAVSRRQLERLFKQHLSTVPSRYYLDIRLQRARKLLRETRHSLLQVALMCGFSSGSHFSTTYSSVFGVAPRDERQRVLASIAR